MNYMHPKIGFYRKRNFSEKLNVTFQFIRENWKPLMKFTVYLLLPICLVQTFVMNAAMKSMFMLSVAGGNINDFNSTGFVANYGILMLCALTGSILLSALIYALMQTYERREYRLVNLQWSDFKAQLTKNIKRSLLLLAVIFAWVILIFTFFGALSGALSLISTVLVVLVILIAFAVILALMPFFALLFPVFIWEPQLGVMEAMRKSWKFGYSDFWSLLGFLIVISIIASVLQTITMMPWYILTVVGNIFAFGLDSTVTQSIFYKFAIFIFGIIQSMGNYIASIIMMIGLAFQYFHSREKNEGVTIDSNIINFNELK